MNRILRKSSHLLCLQDETWQSLGDEYTKWKQRDIEHMGSSCYDLYLRKDEKVLIVWITMKLKGGWMNTKLKIDVQLHSSHGVLLVHKEDVLKPVELLFDDYLLVALDLTTRCLNDHLRLTIDTVEEHPAYEDLAEPATKCGAAEEEEDAVHAMLQLPNAHSDVALVVNHKRLFVNRQLMADTVPLFKLIFDWRVGHSEFDINEPDSAKMNEPMYAGSKEVHYESVLEFLKLIIHHHYRTTDTFITHENLEVLLGMALRYQSNVALKLCADFLLNDEMLSVLDKMAIAGKYDLDEAVNKLFAGIHNDVKLLANFGLHYEAFSVRVKAKVAKRMSQLLLSIK